MKKQFTLLLAVFTLCFFNNVDAQVSVPTAGSPVVVDFTGYEGGGFDNPPAAGQLSSLNWNFTGFQDAYTYGGLSLADYGKGVRSIPGPAVTSGGLYGLLDTVTGNQAFWVQPTGGDFTPGTITLYMVNNTGAAITSLAVAYDILVFNDNLRSNSFNFSYSTDDVTYTPVPDLDYNSPDTATGALVTTPMATILTPVNISSGAVFYLRWSGNDVSGFGSRDEFGLDNISVTASTGTPTQVLSFATTGSTVNEDTVSYMIEVAVDITSANATSVNVVIDTASTADVPGDFTFAPSTLVFPANSTASQFITVTVVNDLTAESVESAIFNLENATNGANIINGTHTATILDDDNIIISFDPNFDSGLEAAAGTVNATITIDNPQLISTDVDVALDALSSSATSGVDFTFTNTTVTFGAGPMSSQTVSFTVLDEGVFEDDETIVLTLTNPTNGALIGAGTYTFTITNDDARMTGPCTDLFISEYIEGSSNNKAVEIYNPTDAAIDLSEYTMRRYNNGSLTPGTTFNLSGTLAAGDVYVMANSSSDSIILAAATTTSGSVTFYNGNDALELYHFGDLIDVIGVVGQDSFWVVDDSFSTGESTIVRNADVQEGTTDWTTSAATQWTGYPQNTFSFIGSHTADPCGPQCVPPTGVTATVTGPRTVTLSWDVVPGSLGYEISGGAAGSNPANYVTIVRSGVNNTSFNVINLCINFSYDWRVRTICSMDGGVTTYSTYSATNTFKTATCGSPAPASSQNVTNSSVTLTWTAVNGAIGYRIQGQASGGSLVTLDVSGGATTTFQVNNLPSNKSFVWQVRAACAISTPCSGGVAFGPAAASSFTTLPSASEKQSEAMATVNGSVSVFPNPFTSTATVKFSNPNNGLFTFVMTDLSGRTVNVMENITGNTLVIEKGSLTAGIYFFELRGTENFNGKVILK